MTDIDVTWAEFCKRKPDYEVLEPVDYFAAGFNAAIYRDILRSWSDDGTSPKQSFHEYVESQYVEKGHET